MEGLASLLFYALLFYLMMRFGCGAHMIHGHGVHGSKQESDSGTFIDPVCGNEVDQNKGYGLMHKANLYRFCSRHCLEQFDEQPSLFMRKQRKEINHEH